MFFSLFSTHFKWSKPGLKQNCEASLSPINQDFLESCQYVAVTDEKYFYHCFITSHFLVFLSISGFVGPCKKSLSSINWCVMAYVNL